MSNLEIYNDAFMESMCLSVEQVSEAKRENIDKWDSIGHMSLIAILEDEFGIEFEPEDILQFASYNEGIRILEKYKIGMEN